MSEENKNPLLEGAKEGMKQEWKKEGWRMKGALKSTILHMILITFWAILDIGIRNQFMVGMLSENALEYVPGIFGYFLTGWLFYELYLKGRTKYPKRQAALWLIASHPLMYSPFKDDIEFVTKFRIF
ncbi:MAG: hypothetical protein QG650_169 [Patescibacteria group bacterium]|nr:hypothetical protein [Patescibacteria group bacterium]